jgi:peroxiredoxin
LQRTYEELRATGTEVFVISYDSVEVLDAFAKHYGVTYHLLSDVGSHVIQRLGMLNTKLYEQQAAIGVPVAERHAGTPFAGTLVLDEDGVVVDKVVENDPRVRPSADAVRSRFTSGPPAQLALTAALNQPQVGITAGLASPVYRPFQQLVLHVTVEVEPGLHVYTRPTPPGLSPLGVDLRPRRSVVMTAPQMPSSTKIQTPGLDGELHVLEGRIALQVPFHIVPLRRLLPLWIDVTYQACSDTECYPPAQVSLAIGLRGKDVEPSRYRTRSALGDSAGW